MKYKQYLITKYNPEYRDEYGCYTHAFDEWSEIGDIGKSFGGKIFTAQEYLETENKYINVLIYLMNLCEIDLLRVSGLEKYKRREFFGCRIYSSEQDKIFNSISEGQQFSSTSVVDAFRLCIRGDIFCRFYSQRDHFVFYTDGNMYFHVFCKELSNEEVLKIKEVGLIEVICDS